MVWNRRFLRVVALGAVFALGLAGTALAATYKWNGNGTGGNANKWNANDNWDPIPSGTPGHPADGDTAIIETGTVTIDDATALEVKVLELGDGVDLTLSPTSLTIKNGELRALGNATVDVQVTNGLVFTDPGEIVVANGKTLTLKSTDDLTINATVTGNLNLEVPAVKTINLKKDVDGKVGFKDDNGAFGPGLSLA